MSQLNKWGRGLRLKLLLVTIIPMVALGLVAFLGINTTLDLDNEIDKAYQVRARLIEFTSEMNINVSEGVRRLWTALNVDNPAEITQAIERTRKHVELFEAARDNYEKIPRSPKMIEMFEVVHKEWPAGKELILQLASIIEKDVTQGKAIGPKFIIEKIRPQMTKVSNALNEIQTARREIMDKEVAELDKDTKFDITMLIAVSLIASFISLAMGLMLATKMANELTQISSTLNASSDQVKAAADQISASSQELSQATNEQAASMEETATSLEEMSSMVAKNTENAKSTANTSGQSQSKAQEGKNSVDRMMQAMQEINQSNESIMQQINHSNEQMTEIVKVIQDIGAKTKVINEIVFQTKLLSFNASVEAARAGEHGKGFAVVAEEVGNLAQMSGNAAKEISSMLDGSMQKVESIIRDTKSGVESLIQDGRSKVELGNQVANECSGILNEIVTNVEQVSVMAKDISHASEEQTKGISEINKAMGQLDTVTQQNSATSEEAASAAEELSVQADALKSVVNQLIQLIDGEQQHAGHQVTYSHQGSFSPGITEGEHKAKLLQMDRNKKKTTAAPVNQNKAA